MKEAIVNKKDKIKIVFTDIDGTLFSHKTNRVPPSAIEAIEKWNLIDQYKWERDVVLEQLKEIGCVFGQNMEKEKEAIDKSHPSKLIAKDIIGETNSRHYLCSNCGEYICNEKEYKLKEIYNYCPNCGQAIDGGQLL